ncbi:MAG: FAD-dependent monooxygenase [Bacteroidota bacterium]
MIDYDILIVGGGPAGSILARSLASSEKSILLLEGSDYSAPRVGETLPAHIMPELKRLGLWDDFLGLNPRKSYGIESAWNEHNPTFKSHILNPLGNSWHVNRNDFDKLLYLQAKKHPKVAAYTNVRVKNLRQLPDYSWQITWNSAQGETRAHAAIYIDATGRKSPAKNKDKVAYQSFDQLVGVGCILDSMPEQALNHLILNACKDGWWYAAPLQQSKSVIFLMTDLDIVRNKQLTKIGHWKATMPADATIFKAFKRLIKNDEKLIVRQAQSQIVETIHVDQFFTVGDALVSFDPLTGLGVTRAIQTAMGLARFLKAYDHLNPAICQLFLDQIRPLFQNYLSQWHHTYTVVKEWKDCKFWKRRHEMIIN